MSWGTLCDRHEVRRSGVAMPPFSTKTRCMECGFETWDYRTESALSEGDYRMQAGRSHSPEEDPVPDTTMPFRSKLSTRGNTEVRYACGHTERRNLYGSEYERRRILAADSQAPCPECRAKRATGGGSRIHPRIFRRSADIALDQTYDCWALLSARGYDLVPVDWAFDGIPPSMNDRTRWAAYVQRMADDPPKKWYKAIPPGEMEAEIEWLQSELGAVFYTGDPTGWELKLPRAFARCEFSPGLRDRVAMACHRLALALRKSGRPFVAFSGGKDSSVCLALAEALRPDIPAIWSDDELEFPETVALQEATADRLAERYRVVQGFATHAGWFQPWRDSPPFRPPLPMMEPIGQLMEPWAQQEGYDLTVLGLRGDESKARGAWLDGTGGTYRRRFGMVCCPIWDWDTESVWAFLRATNTPYCAAYDRMTEIGIDPEIQRVGPLPLVPRETLAAGWPELLSQLDTRYPNRWR